MHEMIPPAAVIAVLVNPNNPQADSQANELQAAGSMLRRQLMILKAGSEADVDAAFATLAQRDGSGRGRRRSVFQQPAQRS